MVSKQPPQNGGPPPCRLVSTEALWPTFLFWFQFPLCPQRAPSPVWLLSGAKVKVKSKEQHSLCLCALDGAPPDSFVMLGTHLRFYLGKFGTGQCGLVGSVIHSGPEGNKSPGPNKVPSARVSLVLWWGDESHTDPSGLFLFSLSLGLQKSNSQCLFS